MSLRGAGGRQNGQSTSLPLCFPSTAASAARSQATQPFRHPCEAGKSSPPRAGSDTHPADVPKANSSWGISISENWPSAATPDVTPCHAQARAARANDSGLWTSLSGEDTRPVNFGTAGLSAAPKMGTGGRTPCMSTAIWHRTGRPLSRVERFPKVEC